MMVPSPTCSVPEYPTDLLGGEVLKYNSTYGSVINHMGQALQAGRAIDFWQPGRLVGGLLDYKIRNPGEIEDVADLVVDATQVAIDTHAGTLTPEKFKPLTRRIDYYPGIRHSKMIQDGDPTTAIASSPASSQEVATMLHSHTNGEGILLVPLGHGGITAGVLTYIHYARLSRADDSAIYPVRFSTQKKNDTEPRLNEEEIVHLRTIQKDTSHVVVFDEDCASGDTMRGATYFFNNLLGRETIPATNDGPRGEPLIGAALERAINF